MSPDIRDQLEPLADDTSADATARTVTAHLLDEILRTPSGLDPEGALRTALRVDRLLRPLTDEQLAGVQALGQALAAFPSQYRAARRAGRP